MQLDIFEHSRDVMLRNDVLQALQRRDAPAARAAWQRLGQEYAQDETLYPFDTLIAALQVDDPTPFADHAALAAARRELQGPIATAALRSFGVADGAAWLRPLWRCAAQRAPALEYDAAFKDEHAAPLWLMGGDATAAVEAAGRIESWRRIPAPLAWMTEAHLRLHGLDESWSLLAELAWLAPQRFAELTGRLADPVLNRLLKQFEAVFEADGEGDDGVNVLSWFPAWALTEKPALAQLLGRAAPGLQAAPERGMRLLLDLLHLESQGRQRDLIDQRKKLRDLHASLFACYMSTR